MKLTFPSLNFPLLFLFFTLTLTFILNGCVVDAAPFWLKEGAYAYYEVSADITYYENITHVSQVWGASGTYGWKCLEVAGDSAMLEVTINVSGTVLASVDEQGIPTWREWQVEEKINLSINVENRKAYINGEPVGILPYWMPTDVEEGEPITNFTTYGNHTLSAVVYGGGYPVETPYKTFEGHELRNVLTEGISLPGASIHNFLFYEKESGILISGRFVDNIWIRKAMAKNIWGPGEGAQPFNLKETNIWFTPESPPLLEILSPYIITAAAVIAAIGITLVYATKIRKKTPKALTTSPTQSF